LKVPSQFLPCLFGLQAFPWFFYLVITSFMPNNVLNFIFVEPTRTLDVGVYFSPTLVSTTLQSKEIPLKTF